MKVKWWLVIGMALGVSFFVVFQLKKSTSLSLQDIHGKPYLLDQFRGSAMVLHFWASWCPPCLDEIPDWVSLARRLEGKKVKMIAVSVDEKWENALKVFPSQGLPENLVSLLDPTGQLAEKYGTFQFPETYLISKNLKMIQKWVGPQDWNQPSILQAIQRVAQAEE